MTSAHGGSANEFLMREVARRLQPLLPERLRLIPDRDGITVYEQGSGLWSVVDLRGLRFEVDHLVEHALSSIQDTVVHAVSGAWPPIGAPYLHRPWARRDGNLLRLGFEPSPELEPISLEGLALAP